MVRQAPKQITREVSNLLTVARVVAVVVFAAVRKVDPFPLELDVKAGAPLGAAPSFALRRVALIGSGLVGSVRIDVVRKVVALCVVAGRPWLPAPRA